MTLKKVGELLEIPPEALATARTGERLPPAPPEVISEQVRFDQATNPAVALAAEAFAERFQHLTAAERDQLVSQFGVGGALTSEGVLKSLERMEADRKTMAQLQIVLQTHLRDAARQVIDGLYRTVCVAPPATGQREQLEKL